ncbi:tetratricopeptide repeat protein [Actinomadura roseirufa]|uniref:tetratricopeptide repeat protein n=1 Tax=Actinomadura roseirufa TaxID=2094049 RepID=UPI0013F15F5B
MTPPPGPSNPVATWQARAAAAAPLLGEAAGAQDGGDADALFKAGKFEQAGRAYEEILKAGPTNVHAARQRGYVGLLANRFAEAEKYLTMALGSAPGDKETSRLIAATTRVGFRSCGGAAAIASCRGGRRRGRRTMRLR